MIGTVAALRTRVVAAAVAVSLVPPAGAIVAEAVPLRADPVAATAAFEAALAAQKTGNSKAYLEGIERAAALLPDPSRLLYRLAAARLAAGDRPGALEALERQAAAGFVRNPRGDAAFAALASEPAFVELASRLDAADQPIVASEALVELPERAALFEGIARHPSNGSFFFSSVHQRKVVVRRSDGTVSDFVEPGAHGLGAALGLAVDAPRRLLWIVSAGLPQAKGLSAAERDRSALLAVDLDTGELRRRVEAPPGKRWWNDLAIAADGTVYVSDSGTPSVARVAADGTVTTVVEGSGLRSPGGVALSANERALYVADWSNGLAVVDLASGSLAWLEPPGNATLLGIDGLRLVPNGREGSLVAIQNGVPPHRIVRLALGAGGRSIAAAEILERAVPGWDEPTLGVVVDGALVYVATSQWPRFGEDGATPDAASLTATTVRRLPLAAAVTP